MPPPLDQRHGRLGTSAGDRGRRGGAERGGNAVDAAIAVGPHAGRGRCRTTRASAAAASSLIRRADGKLVAIDGRETAPRKATRDMYFADGKPQPDLSQIGPLAVADARCAGRLTALALKSIGRLKLADLVLPAAEIAEKAFRSIRRMPRHLARTAAKLRRSAAERCRCSRPIGSPYAEGEVAQAA